MKFVVLIMIGIMGIGIFCMTHTESDSRELCGRVLYKEVGRINAKLYQFSEGNHANISSSYPLLDSIGVFVQSQKDKQIIYGSIRHAANEASLNLINLKDQSRRQLAFVDYGGILGISVSRNDSLVAILVNDRKNRISPFFSEASILIMDINSKQVVHSIEQIGGAALVSLSEFAWKDNDKLVFSVSGKIDPKAVDKEIYLRPGIYVFSLITNELIKLHESFGSRVQYNMKGDNIAFKTRTTVHVFAEDQEYPQEVLDLGERFNINSLRWSPCDPYVLLVVFWDKKLRRTKQYFIDVKTGEKEEVYFRCFVEKIYSWAS